MVEMLGCMMFGRYSVARVHLHARLERVTGAGWAECLFRMPDHGAWMRVACMPSNLVVLLQISATVDEM